MRNNGTRVLEVPELLTSVASRLNNRNCIQLMLVSRHCFDSVGPTIWRKIPRLDFLLRLIKGTKVEFRRFRDSQGAHYKFTEVKITLPSEPDLYRFNVYAPWVHQLEVFGGAYSQEIVNKKPLLQLAAEHSLLPNLRRLTTYTGAEIESNALLEFIYTFFSPSLTEIRTILHKAGHPSYVDPTSVPAFLQKVQNTCPQIKVLEFYPQGSPYAFDGPDKFYIPGDDYRLTLASLTNLRSFASTLYILQPETFSILGSLPWLESLSITGCWEDDPVLDENLSIPDTWFPCLKELRLIEIHRVDVTILWNQPSLVRKLTSAYVHVHPCVPVDSDTPPLDGNNWIELFVLNLPRLSPSLRKFGLKPEDVEEDTSFQLSPDAHAALRKLGLQNFELELAGGY